MSARHTEILTRIGLAGAIVPTYIERVDPDSDQKQHLNKIDFFVTKAIRIYGKAGSQNLKKIESKIDLMREKTCLGKARSIMTFIDYAVELLERSLVEPKSLASIGGAVGIKTIKELVFALLDFRVSVSKQEYALCLEAGKRAADIWEETKCGG